MSGKSRSAKLRRAILTASEFDGAKYDDKTVWPLGYEPPIEARRMASRKRASRKRAFDQSSSQGFSGANLEFANFNGKNLSRQDFSNSTLDFAQFKKAILTSANFNSTILGNAKFKSADLRNATFSGAKASSSSFADVEMSDVDLKSGTFHFVDFTNADMLRASGKAYFKSCKFDNTRLYKASLSGSNFTDSQFLGVDFSGAKLVSCDFSSAEFIDVDFSGADLTGSDLDSAEMKAIKWDKNTKWPRGFRPPSKN